MPWVDLVTEHHIVCAAGTRDINESMASSSRNLDYNHALSRCRTHDIA